MKKFNLKSIALATTMALSVVSPGGVQALATSDPSLEQTITSTADNQVELESLNIELERLQYRNNTLIYRMMFDIFDNSEEERFLFASSIPFSNPSDGVASFLCRALNSNDIQYKRRIIQSATLRIQDGERLLETVLSRRAQ